MKSDGSNVVLDHSFVELALRAGKDPTRLDALRQHAALDPIIRHKGLFGPVLAERGKLVRELLGNMSDPAGARRVLEMWRNRAEDLRRCIEEARGLLPPDFVFSGQLIDLC